MQDSFGRVIDYARISVTEHCNLKCVYCMPDAGDAGVSAANLSCAENASPLLSCDDIRFLCEELTALGVTQFRITGGEPLIRPRVHELVRSIKEISGVSYVGLTTNGILLPAQAKALAAAGLDGINISLDTMNHDRYRQITRNGDLTTALAGIQSAFDAGIPKIKINCVPMDGIVEEDVVRIAGLAKEKRFHIRFIEMMPIGGGDAGHMVENKEIRAMLEGHFGSLTPWAGKMGNGPAEYFSVSGFQGSVGFISAMSSSFCQKCNRIRITSDGTMKTCLHMDQGVTLYQEIKAREGKLLRNRLEQAVWNKPARHHFGESTVAGADQRHMFQIGG